LPSFDQEARKKYKEIAGAVQKQIADFESTARDIIERSLKLLLVLVDDTSKL
jgi:BMFP domain-containing protein YqiC